ncbi:MAG: hypothetical protein KTV68_18225 [Acidimicrobiia bacterium]|nr:hypothetical protein [Acidimicrobiia bacterium]MCY4434327.1 hypothetical protein [bacterium]
MSAAACFDKGYREGRAFAFSGNPRQVETKGSKKPWRCSDDDYYRGVHAGCRSVGASCWWDQ